MCNLGWSAPCRTIGRCLALIPLGGGTAHAKIAPLATRSALRALAPLLQRGTQTSSIQSSNESGQLFCEQHSTKALGTLECCIECGENPPLSRAAEASTLRTDPRDSKRADAEPELAKPEPPPCGPPTPSRPSNLRPSLSLHPLN